MRYALLAILLGSAAAAQADEPKDLQLFLLVGQSNMAGRGVVEAADQQPIPNVFMFTEKMEWAPAIDPMHFDKPAVAGVGIGRSFAKTLLERAPGVSIGLIPAAFGGSALDEWGPDSPHYLNAIERARAAMKSGKLRGILWHQGEAESGKEELARSYRERFSKLVERFRKDLDAPDVPVVVGQLGPFFAGKFASVVNEQLATVPLVIPHSGFVSSAGLEHKGDSVHFNTASLHEFGRRYALAYLALDPTWSTGPPANPATSSREMPPEVKAFIAARNTKDPQKKVAALEKFQSDFPKSEYWDSAADTILSTLVKSMPGEVAKISTQASAMYRHASKKDKGRTAVDIAEDLLEGPVLLKEAAGYAGKAVAALNQGQYLKEQRDSYAKRKQTAPSEDELRKQFARIRAGRVSTLGLIYLKMGEEDRGRKLLEEALAGNPGLPSANAALGEMAAKEGRDQAALGYLIAARLGGATDSSTLAAFDSVYRKTHGGTLEGADALLDAEYRKRFPNPVHVEAYQPSEKRGGRVVLAEVFTGAGCPPCAGADVAFDAAMERYRREDVVVLMYHQHIPRPDPMANPASVARFKDYSLQSVPTFLIDGKRHGGGGPRETAGEVYRKFNPDIEKDLESGAEAHLVLQASVLQAPPDVAHTVKVHAAVDKVKSEKKLTLRMALVEKEITYTGENGIRFHPMVVRATHEFALSPVQPAKFDYTFDLAQAAEAALKNLTDLEKDGFRGEDYHFKIKKNEINPANLAVAVWVQEDEGKHVLQAAWADLSGSGAKAATE